MNKGIFITGSGTDVGKTYVTALLLRKLREMGCSCGYYKAAVSGADSIKQSDAGYVNTQANLEQKEETLLSYLYKTPVSPHLAAQLEGNPVCLSKIEKDYTAVCKEYDYIVVEGSGGIVCPIRWDEQEHILLEDIVQHLSLPTLVVADAGLGTINATVLTVSYLQNKGIPVRGVILSRFDGSVMHKDNEEMIAALTGVPIVAVVREGEDRLSVSPQRIMALFEEETKWI